MTYDDYSILTIQIMKLKGNKYVNKDHDRVMTHHMNVVKS